MPRTSRGLLLRAVLFCLSAPAQSSPVLIVVGEEVQGERRRGVREGIGRRRGGNGAGGVREKGKERDEPGLRNDNVVEWCFFATEAREADLEDHGGDAQRWVWLMLVLRVR